MARTADGDVLVSHLVDDEHTHQVEEETGFAMTSGALSRRRYPLPSPVKQIAFRGMNLSVGRFGANAVRSILQKVLITGKPRTEARFAREIQLLEDDIVIHDHIDIADAPGMTVTDLTAGSDATSIYVANSNTFQESVLTPWVDLSEHTEALNRLRHLSLPPRRVFGGADEDE